MRTVWGHGGFQEIIGRSPVVAAIGTVVALAVGHVRLVMIRGGQLSNGKSSRCRCRRRCLVVERRLRRWRKIVHQNNVRRWRRKRIFTIGYFLVGAVDRRRRRRWQIGTGAPHHLHVRHRTGGRTGRPLMRRYGRIRCRRFPGRRKRRWSNNLPWLLLLLLLI